MVEIAKTILRLSYNVSVITLHLYYFLTGSERSFGEGGRKNWRENISKVSPSTLLF